AGGYRRALDACTGSSVWRWGVDRRAVIAAIFTLPSDAPTRRRTIHRLGADLCAGASGNRSGYCSDHAELSQRGTTRAALDQCVFGRDGWVCGWRDSRITACTFWKHALRSGIDRAGYCTHGDRPLLTTDRHYCQGIHAETGGRWELPAYYRQWCVGWLDAEIGKRARRASGEGY